MKHNTLPFTLALLFCLLWGAACALAEPEWMYPVSLETLRDPQDVLRLVNRDHLLDAAYPDQETGMYRLVDVTVPVTKGSHVLRQVANDALAELFAAAERAGYSLYVGSSYRNYRTQEVIHYNRVQRMGYDDGYSQIAGASEHQMGLAADVVSWAYRDSFQESFGETLEGIWLRENCANYGFILRYPQDKEEITGVRYEPWHLRYVGREAALYMTLNGLTLEEFTEEYQAALSRYERNLEAGQAQGETSSQ